LPGRSIAARCHGSMIKESVLTTNLQKISTFGLRGQHLLAFVATVIVAAGLAGCAGNDEQDSVVNNVTEAYERAQDAMRNGNYRRAIQIFEALRARFPFSDFSKQLHLELMYAYYKVGQREQAIDAADQFLRENPTHPRVDYALYIKALSYFEQDRGVLERVFRKDVDGRPPRDAELAFSLFSRLVERYPASEYAMDSRQRMIYLKNRLAAYENAVARYYVKIGAYVAALNRAKNAIEQYNGADGNLESLEIMIKAYEGLGMADLAEDTRRVLAENKRAETLSKNDAL
jgi:outer membrane protein assembly factor BamD